MSKPLEYFESPEGAEPFRPDRLRRPHPTTSTNNKLTHPARQLLSDAAGESTLYIAPQGYPNQGMSSLYHQAALSLEVLVPIRTLDGLLYAQVTDRLDLIKIDTQGNDHKMLLGGERGIREFRPYLIFEYDKLEWGRSDADFADCDAFFRRQLYTSYVINVTGSLTKAKQGVLKSANILAVPPGV